MSTFLHFLKKNNFSFFPALGNRRGRFLQFAPLSITNYTYDADTHKLSAITAADVTVTPKTDVLGRATGKRICVGETEIAEESISYLKHGDHATSLPVSVRYASGGVWTDQLRYTYDEMGNISAIYEDDLLSVRYAYDSLNRLVREDNRALGKTVCYAYDDNGNRTAVHTYPFTLKSADRLAEELNIVYISHTREIEQSHNRGDVEHINHGAEDTKNEDLSML